MCFVYYNFSISRKTTVLVKSDEAEVLDEIERVVKKGKPLDEVTMEAWGKAGLVFPSTPEGVRLMHTTEEKNLHGSRQTMKKPSSMKFSSADVYINAGTERCVIRAFRLRLKITRIMLASE